jgi:hypothetical protein
LVVGGQTRLIGSEGESPQLLKQGLARAQGVSDYFWNLQHDRTILLLLYPQTENEGMLEHPGRLGGWTKSYPLNWAVV